MKCIDTTYFVDLIRRPSAIRTITQKLDTGGVHATTVFNVYEALFGAYAIKDEEKRGKVEDKLKKANFTLLNPTQYFSTASGLWRILKKNHSLKKTVKKSYSQRGLMEPIMRTTTSSPDFSEMRSLYADYCYSSSFSL